MNPALKTSLGVIILIFFFNRILLPFNLQYSMVLAPFFIYYLYQNKFLNKLLLPLAIITIYSIIHLFIGVVFKDFMVSSLVEILILIFLYSFFFFFKKTNDFEFIIKRLTQLNFLFTILSLIALLTNKFVAVFWYLVPFTAGYKVIPRLKIFELEASFYSFALLPLFYYYFWKLLKKYDLKTLLLFLSLVLSLVLSFSLGIIAVIGISLVMVLSTYLIKFLKFAPSRKAIGFFSIVSVIVFFGLLIFYPQNPLFFRIDNLFNGLDTSGRGRTYEALEIGWEVLFQNNPLFGIGLGQFKIIGRETLLEYYHFTTTPEVARLPNSIAETMVSYGLIGLIIRLGLQGFFFVKLKVYRNLFQLSLFFALFIYQFTGSYFFNSIEYVIWIIAIYPKLSSFNLSNYFTR